MDRERATDLLVARLGNRTGLHASIHLEMELVQERLERWELGILPWFLIAEVGSSTLVVDDYRLNLPTDFLSLYKDWPVQIQRTDAAGDGKWHELESCTVDEAHDRYPPSSDSDTPAGFALLGHCFRFYPTPDFAYPVRFIYYAKDTTLATNNENDWLKHAANLIIAMTGEQMARYYIRSPELAQTFSMEAAQEKVRLLRANVAREQEALESLTMGGKD